MQQTLSQVSTSKKRRRLGRGKYLRYTSETDMMMRIIKQIHGTHKPDPTRPENNPLHDHSNFSILNQGYSEPSTHPPYSPYPPPLPSPRLERLNAKRHEVQSAFQEDEGELAEQQRTEERHRIDSIPERDLDLKIVKAPKMLQSLPTFSMGMGTSHGKLPEGPANQISSEERTDTLGRNPGMKNVNLNTILAKMLPEIPVNRGSFERHSVTNGRPPGTLTTLTQGYNIKSEEILQHNLQGVNYANFVASPSSSAQSPLPSLHKTSVPAASSRTVLETVMPLPNDNHNVNINAKNGLHGTRSLSENGAIGRGKSQDIILWLHESSESFQEDEEFSENEEFEEFQRFNTSQRSSSTGTYSNPYHKTGIPMYGSYKAPERYSYSELDRDMFATFDRSIPRSPRIRSPQSLSPRVPVVKERALSLPPINIPPRYPPTYFLPPGARSTSASPTSTSPRPPLTPVDLKTPVKGLWVKSNKIIGSGGFGKVYKCRNKETGKYFAAKVVPIKAAPYLDQMKHEIDIMKKIGRHPNIVHYIGTERDDESVTIFLEWMENGSLQSVLKEFPEPLDERTIRTYTRQVLKGLAHLHEMDVVHRDVKGGNILLDRQGTAKLADFGLSKFLVNDSTDSGGQGTIWWMAPETIAIPGKTAMWECGQRKNEEEVEERQKQGYGKAVDIWSLGCTVIEMATGGLQPWFDSNTKKPFWVPASEQFWEQGIQVQANFQIGKATGPPPIPDLLSDVAKDFIRSCCRVDPSLRPTARDLLQHPFIQEAPSGLLSPLYFRRGVEGSGELQADWGEEDIFYGGSNRPPANGPDDDRIHNPQENSGLSGVHSTSEHIQNFEARTDASHKVTGSPNFSTEDLMVALKQLKVARDSTTPIAARGNKRNQSRKAVIGRVS